MEAHFSWRRTRASDLPACMGLHPAKNGADILGAREALKAWQRVLEMAHATRSAVVEQHANTRSEIVGFALSTFVKKSFAEAEVRDPRPGLNSRILGSVLNGNSVIATYEEVREANTRGDLEQVNLDTSLKTSTLTAAQANEVQIVLGSAFRELYCGYMFSRLFMEIVDELDSAVARSVRAFKTIKRFDPSPDRNSDEVWQSERALVALDAETMRDDPLSVGALVFQRRARPELGLTRGEQELLELALEGMDDSDAAKTLNVSLPAIKHRWANIFERVAAVRPDVCPLDVNRTRGIQKRQRVLTHVRRHPEELRPFDFSK